jgi:hypothetical protein
MGVVKAPFSNFFGPLQGYQPTLSPPPSRTLRVPAQLWTLALASDLRSSLAMHFLDHGRVLAADDPSTSPYAANALLPMSVAAYDTFVLTGPPWASPPVAQWVHWS